MPSKQIITVRETGPNSFAVIGADGQVIRGGFSLPQVAFMWAARRGLHQSRTKRRREVAIPADLTDERILPIKTVAQLNGQSYGTTLADAKAGAYGPLFQIGERTFGIRFGNWKQSIAQREIKTTAE